MAVATTMRILYIAKGKEEKSNESGSGGGVMISMLCKSLLLLNVFHASCDNKIKVEVNSE